MYIWLLSSTNSLEILFFWKNCNKSYRVNKPIGSTLIYFKMDVMPLVPETKTSDVSILISLGNLLTRRTTWLMLKTTPATSISSRVFGAYYTTRILYKYAHLPTLTLFSHFHLQGQHTLSSVTSRENTLNLSISTNRIKTLFLFFYI